ncbi:hypothetical protein BJ912DRAFT_1140793 [Pholiota molesta]|nr:hypothetical protein BJ912DRAFT_1140793 [Pholiota molesta]
MTLATMSSLWRASAAPVKNVGSTTPRCVRRLIRTSTRENIMPTAPNVHPRNDLATGGICQLGRYDGETGVALKGACAPLSHTAWIGLATTMCVRLPSSSCFGSRRQGLPLRGDVACSVDAILRRQLQLELALPCGALVSRSLRSAASAVCSRLLRPLVHWEAADSVGAVGYSSSLL